jgi:hypothetical protein
LTGRSFARPLSAGVVKLAALVQAVGAPAVVLGEEDDADCGGGELIGDLVLPVLADAQAPLVAIVEYVTEMLIQHLIELLADGSVLRMPLSGRPDGV